jgi:hypothetical protein
VADRAAAVRRRGRTRNDRRANFDIYLPEWLARHNQRIFGSLYAIGVAYLVATYLGAGKV